MSSLIPAVALIFFAMFTIVMTGFAQAELQCLEQTKLKYATGKSIDAAIDQMLHNTDRSLMMDAQDLTAVTVNPNIALETFVDVFLANYDIPLNEQNRAMIRTRYMPVFAVIVNDGYYIASLQQVDTGGPGSREEGRGAGYDLAFSIKYPFTYVSGTAANPIVYNLTLSQIYVHQFRPGHTIPTRIFKPQALLDELGGNQGTQRRINRIIIDHMGNEIARINADAGVPWEFFIPDDMNTVMSVNPIQSTTVFALLQNVNLTTKQSLSIVSLSGARITEARSVVAYQRAGVMFYCFHDLAPMRDTSFGEDRQIVVLATFPNVFLAAAAGYHPDIRYLLGDPGYDIPGTFRR
jgi:hypothetical protein